MCIRSFFLTTLFVSASLAAAAFGCAGIGHAQPRTQATGRGLWVTAYYPTWEQDGYMTPDKIDFTALTHIVQFCILPKPDGTIDSTPGRTVPPAYSQALITRAHAAGRKVLVALGGSESRQALSAVLSGPNRDGFIQNLVQFVMSRGYDGIDIDMEPLQDEDVAPYAAFVPALRARMKAADPDLLLTAAVVWQPALFARLQDDFDQINIMTYDLSGPWSGFNTWFDSSLKDSHGQLMPCGVPYPSVEGSVRQFAQAGVAKSKLGIGIAFFGYAWTGATGPRQSIQGTAVTQPSYHEIMDTEFQPSLYHWDEQAQAPYLSIDAPQPKDRRFISYDDERLCAEKIAYAKREGLGGMMIWELGDGYRADQPEGQRDMLLQAVKRALLGSPAAAKTTTGQERGKSRKGHPSQT